MLGTTAANPTSLNVGVTKRLKSILGDRSPEWSAIKQGLWSRLTSAGEGATPLGPGKVAQNLSRFLHSDGKEMATQVFSGAERDLMAKYVDLMRHLEVPQAGANWSNTAAFAAEGYMPSVASRALHMIGNSVGSLIAGHLGGMAGGAATAKIAGASGQGAGSTRRSRA